ncbi:hypothetical protein RRG08_033798 [Elysia crispata]|uniref:Uncharacterized protein n=1 Tax=Elysia crispata TaxID=231223 RepID=A0AAE1B858_9GAST|nr:hypothetical protein RRG08_033798 [Elysia crispata]
MDKMVMHTALFTLVLLLVTVAPGLVTAQAYETTARRFCVNALGQSKYDATQCLLKPRGFNIGSRDPAVLTYLCCLGSFNDVTYNYVPYVAQGLIMTIVNSASASNLLRIGSFIGKCSRRKVKVSLKDFNYWNRNGRTLKVCHSPWRK